MFHCGQLEDFLNVFAGLWLLLINAAQITGQRKLLILFCSNRKGQQYDCKWYVPLADLTFQTIEDCESTPIPLVQDEEIDAMKIKISQIKNDIQREKVRVGTQKRTKQTHTRQGDRTRHTVQSVM